MADHNRLLKADEVGRLLGLGKSKVYEMMQARELPVVRIGGARRVPLLDLQRWIRERTEAANSDQVH
jgi:excisionase family DNA binding protein